MQLVVDANVLLSAVIGGRAKLVLQHPDIEAVYTPVFALDASAASIMCEAAYPDSQPLSALPD